MTHAIVRVVRGRGAPEPRVPHIAQRPLQPLVGPPRLLVRRRSHDRVGGFLAGFARVVNGPDLLIGIADRRGPTEPPHRRRPDQSHAGPRTPSGRRCCSPRGPDADHRERFRGHEFRGRASVGRRADRARTHGPAKGLRLHRPRAPARARRRASRVSARPRGRERPWARERSGDEPRRRHSRRRRLVARGDVGSRSAQAALNLRDAPRSSAPKASSRASTPPEYSLFGSRAQLSARPAHRPKKP